ncbi:hypothetical protein ANN_22663 [Periplaneta americana]|uniref:Endonuclease/exonuclease/phosphatase domain-containing protein n=1 Tax=Periplaneta americana TaxID=6978 RepID=A0ABQ8S9P3_PERAM|nr:hypothetical protein ANN_22663 [Periplaneta americana]
MRDSFTLQPLFSSPVPIEKQKLKDLPDLRKMGIIPDQYHHNADEEAKQNYQVEISNKFATLESSGEVEKVLDVNSVWENIRDSIKIAAEQNIGYYETKKKKPWFDEDCCMVVERKKQAKLKFLQDPVEEKRDNYFNERLEASRTLRNKKRGYLKEKLNEVETNCKNKNIRDLHKGIKGFKNGYQPRVNVIKDENGDLLADYPSILNRWKNYFAQLLNVHRPNRNDRDEIEIQTAEPFIPEPTLSEVEIAIENLKKHKSPGIDQIPAEFMQEGGSALYSEIYKLVLAIWEKEIVPEQWKESLIVPIFKKGTKPTVIAYVTFVRRWYHSQPKWQQMPEILEYTDQSTDWTTCELERSEYPHHATLRAQSIIAVTLSRRCSFVRTGQPDLNSSHFVRIDFVGVQEVRLDGKGISQIGDYLLYYEEGNNNHQLGTGFFVHKRIKSAVKKVEFISDRLSHLVLKSRWCDIILINAHVPTEEKDDRIKDSFYEELEHTFDQLPRYHMKILLGDFNAKVGREDIFRPTIGKESLHAISSDNGVRLVNFATSKNLIVKSTTFPHKDIHKYTWTSPDGLTHNQIDHILIDKRRHTSIVDIRTFRDADCNSDHYLVIGELRERLSVAKRVEQQVNITKFNILKLKDEEAKQNYQVEISNRFATLESSDEVEKELDVNSVRENIRDSIKIADEQSTGYYETKKKKPWFDEDCCIVVERRKQAKLKFLQDPVEEKRDNYFNERREASGTLRNKRQIT